MPHVHQLDVTQLDAAFEAELQQRQHLIEVRVAHRHHVHLEPHARGEHPFDAAQHRGQVATARDLA